MGRIQIHIEYLKCPHFFFNFFFGSMEPERKDSGTKDPLAALAKQMGGSKRNALLKWCQQKTVKHSVSTL